MVIDIAENEIAVGVFGLGNIAYAYLYDFQYTAQPNVDAILQPAIVINLPDKSIDALDATIRRYPEFAKPQDA